MLNCGRGIGNEFTLGRGSVGLGHGLPLHNNVICRGGGGRGGRGRGGRHTSSFAIVPGRGQGFSEAELTSFLTAMERDHPVSGNEWDFITKEHLEKFPVAGMYFNYIYKLFVMVKQLQI